MTNSKPTTIVKITIPELERYPPLPNRPSLRLQEATTFAFRGIAYTSDLISLDVLCRLDEEFGGIRPGSIYASIDCSDNAQVERAHYNFNGALSHAAFIGIVKFTQLRERGNGQTPEVIQIPAEYFYRPREFSTTEDSIGEFGGPTRRRSESPTRFNKVFIARDGYFNFLRLCYPTTVASMVSDISTRNTITQQSCVRTANVRPTPAIDKILEADAAVFPDGVPSNMKPGERNRELFKYWEEKGERSPPHERTLRTYYKGR